MGLDMMLYCVPRFKNVSFNAIESLYQKLWEIDSFRYDLKEGESENVELLNKRVHEAKVLALKEAGIAESEWERVAGPDSLFEEVAYWRKFNALHGWFVNKCQNGVDDCGYYEVTKEDLESLLKVLEFVFETRNPSLLPPVGGFFFGSTEVSDWYWEDVEKTIPEIKELLETTDFEKNTLAYHSSW